MQRKIESELVRVRSIQTKNPLQLVSSILVVNNSNNSNNNEVTTAATGSGSKGFGIKKRSVSSYASE